MKSTGCTCWHTDSIPFPPDFATENWHLAVTHASFQTYVASCLRPKLASDVQPLLLHSYNACKGGT